jgi:hypothetical protein
VLLLPLLLATAPCCAALALLYSIASVRLAAPSVQHCRGWLLLLLEQRPAGAARAASQGPRAAASRQPAYILSIDD